MDRQSTYYRQVQLLLKVIPFVAKHECFALKGGTAINLFVRDFPRLSVDIDLVFLTMMKRDEALQTIKEHLEQLAIELTDHLDHTKVVRSYLDKSDALRLVVENQGVQIKIELSPVLRGTVYEPKVVPVSEAVEDEFGYAEIAVVSFADLYAGKICAALDRQHPRDLFDVKLLLDNEGISENLRKALLIYMVSHPRPIAELLKPNFRDLTAVYESEFRNMADQDLAQVELEAIRERLVTLINESLTTDERSFLLSFKSGSPNWELLELSGVSELPAVRWKLQNLAKLKSEKHEELYANLKHILGLSSSA